MDNCDLCPTCKYRIFKRTEGKANFAKWRCKLLDKVTEPPLTKCNDYLSNNGDELEVERRVKVGWAKGRKCAV